MFYNGIEVYDSCIREIDQIVRMLLDKGADINAQGGYYGNALQAALVYGYDQVVRILLDNGAVDINGGALRWASKYGHDHTVRMLLDKRREYYIKHSDFLNSAIATASERGHDEVVQMLLDVGATDIRGEALVWASRDGFDHTV